LKNEDARYMVCNLSVDVVKLRAFDQQVFGSYKDVTHVDQ